MKFILLKNIHTFNLNKKPKIIIFFIKKINENLSNNNN